MRLTDTLGSTAAKRRAAFSRTFLPVRPSPNQQGCGEPVLRCLEATNRLRYAESALQDNNAFDAEEFLARLDAGDFNGSVAEEMRKLTDEQLCEVAGLFVANLQRGHSAEMPHASNPRASSVIK